jgi:hypothetical protein
MAGPPEFPSYWQRILALAAQGAFAPGTVRIVHVRHDHWCALLNRRGPCDCNPDLEMGLDWGAKY